MSEEWVPPEKWVPHDYQVEAVQHLLATPGGGLFLKPGRGKTSSLLAAFKVLQQKGLVNAVLIVAPLRVVKFTWWQEARKWIDFEHFKFITLHGPTKDADLAKKADVYLINFEGLLWLLPKLAKMKEWPFQMLVIDESTKLKAYDSKRFKLLKPLIPKFKRRVILTGTPAPNSMMDLFGQIYVADAGKALGRYITHFRNSFFTLDMSKSPPGQPPNAWAYVMNPGADTLIRKLIEPIVYTSEGPEWEVGQEPLINDIYVELPANALKQHKNMLKLLMAQVESGVVLAANAAVGMSKCIQIASGALYIDDTHNYDVIHDCKLDVVEELLEELSGNPVLIWYHFKSDLARLQAKFPGEVFTAKSKLDIVDRWNAGEIPIMYVHPMSAAHGLNLQKGGNTMVYFTIPCSAEGYNQGIARLARQGQKNQVTVHRILARGTVDESLIKTLARREANQTALLEDLKEFWHGNKDL